MLRRKGVGGSLSLVANYCIYFKDQNQNTLAARCIYHIYLYGEFFGTKILKMHSWNTFLPETM